MKLNQVVIKVIEAATADALTIAVNTFLKNSGEATLLSMHYAVIGGDFSAMIVYTN